MIPSQGQPLRGRAMRSALSLPVLALSFLSTTVGCDGGVISGGTGDAGVSRDLSGGGDIAGCIDRDGDGYGMNCPRGPDCNDQNRLVHPGAMEYCGDGI